jgi:hypothetical protein
MPFATFFFRCSKHLLCPCQKWDGFEILCSQSGVLPPFLNLSPPPEDHWKAKENCPCLCMCMCAYVCIRTCTGVCVCVCRHGNSELLQPLLVCLQGVPYIPGSFTLYSQLGTGIDGAMLILCHTLVHSRVIQAQFREPQIPRQHLHSVLCRRVSPGQGRKIRSWG